jgi:hypothetical protein
VAALTAPPLGASSSGLMTTGVARHEVAHCNGWQHQL